jgi:acyl-coenzyme A synthetase/AMP-(fatty) acid ligase/acyl carrier protein
MGGRVIIAQNALELPELDAKNEVTLLNTVPSAMAELLRMQAVPGSIRTVNLAGEALPGHLVRQTYEGTLAGKVYNLYGPSEDTTFSTFALIEKDARTQPPIGRPLSQSRMYVLDGNQRPVPLGAMGELCIGGEKLARGYFGRPELTAQRFIPNPWSEIGGERLYRTGDLAKYRADGTLDYAGRIDHQVKVRGFRIELGEVEAALRAHDGVKDVVVTATEGIGERKRLIGYVVEKRPGSAGANDLRRYLKPKLPEFMIPSAYVVLDRMPLNRNGKVDRRALPAPAPEARHLTPATSYVAPRSELERSIAAIWQELLGVEEIALDENFFELGGNSLLMVQLRLKLRKVLNRDVPIMELFRNPTVASLAGSASRADESAEMLQDSSARGELRKDALKKRRMSRQPVLSAAN